MQQSPMISCPLKTTTEIDWIGPLSQYIARTYGEPDKYREECATLNRLRQDMRGAGKDSSAGRDLLYRYYGQLELLDLRFPVEERGVRVSFTWYDAFTHKSTAQYSLAFEKASIIFNISAVHSCHAANQNRSEESGIKAAYHSFQAAAGMFTYINENFLHAPSTDLSRDTVKTLISIMLAQAQEVFLEKQIADGKKSGLLAKLAAQAALLYGQAAEGVQENVQKGVFEKSWSILCSAKHSFMDSLAQYLQSLADNDAGQYGLALARLLVSQNQAKEAVRLSQTFPGAPSANSNLSSETGPALVQITKRHLGLVQEKVAELQKDNDFIYHQPVPSEAGIPAVPMVPAAKAIPVQELYAGADINRIIGPDIFQKIVPMSVTESASLYDEEKAKLVRAETEKCDLANAEMVAALDYLKLPNSLKLLKNGFENEIDVADEFREWCAEIAHAPETLEQKFVGLKKDKKKIVEVLDSTSTALDREERVCEQMRAKYQDEWTQQPSSRLTQTLRGDIRSYREAIEAAIGSDNQLWSQYRLVQADIEEIRQAGLRAEEGAVDMLWNSKAGKPRDTPNTGGETLLDVDEGDGPSVMEQIEKVEELLKKLNSIKRERAQVLKDLKEKVHNDDISNVLILNKKAVANQEHALFANELEKFRPHQNRLIQAQHKQSALMKELTASYGDLLQDKRIRAEQSKYESVSRQRHAVLSKFSRTHNAYLDILAGLGKARSFYDDMVETVDSLEKNVETFISNRKSEGTQLLAQIEHSSGTEAERQQKKLRDMMERVSIGSNPAKPPPPVPGSTTGSTSSHGHSPVKTAYSQHTSPPGTPRYTHLNAYHTTPTPPPPPPPHPPQPSTTPGYPAGYPSPYGQPPPPPLPAQPPQNGFPRRDSYNNPPGAPRRDSYQSPTTAGPTPPSGGYHPSHYSSPPNVYAGAVPAGYPPPQPYNPGNYVPPPPPPGPPPAQSGQRGSYGGMPLPQTTYQPPGAPQWQGYPQQQQPPPPPATQPPQQQAQQAQGADPWAGLAGWK